MYRVAILAKYKVAFLAAAVILMSLAFAPAVYGQLEGDACGGAGDPACGTGLVCSGGFCAVTAAEGVCDRTVDPFCIDVVADPIGLGNEPLQVTIAKIINVALSLLGIVAVVIILIGGFKWMTAGGNDEKTAEARKLILAGIIGLAIILSAFAIAKFVLGALQGATGAVSTVE